MEPTVEFPPAIPFTLQATAVLLVPDKIAVYWAEVPSVTLLAPVKVKVIAGGGGAGASKVTERLCEMAGSARLVAMMVTDDDFGAVAGAL